MKGWEEACVGITLFLMISCNGRSGAASDTGSAYYAAQGVKWESQIPVCFDNPSVDGASEARVKSVLEREYNSRTEVSFIGFQRCHSSSQYGIHITWNDTDWPHAALGASGHSQPGSVVLNATFDQSPVEALRDACSKNSGIFDRCFDMVVIHEFGHAIGLAHENLRPERPSTRQCAFFDEHIGNSAIAVVGDYDAESIMNKCFYRPLTGTPQTPNRLSSGDVATINTMYGKGVDLKTKLADCPNGGVGFTYFPEFQRCLITWEGGGGCPEGSIPDDRAGYCKDPQTFACVPSASAPCP